MCSSACAYVCVCVYVRMHVYRNGLRISFFFSGLDNDRGTCLDFIPPTRVYASARPSNNRKGVFAFSSPRVRIIYEHHRRAEVNKCVSAMCICVWVCEYVYKKKKYVPVYNKG